MKDLNNNVKSYNKLFYNSGPVAFNDYINNKYNIIHERLYNDALKLYIKENFRPEYVPEGSIEVDVNKVLNDYKFIEIKNDEFFKPSHIIQLKTISNYSELYNAYKNFENNVYTEDELNEIYNKFQNQIREIDLSPYWNYYQKSINVNKEYDKLNIDEETLKTAKIIYINYLTGKIKMMSRYTGEEFEIDFDTYNSSLKLDEDMKLSNTFTALKNNN